MFIILLTVVLLTTIMSYIPKEKVVIVKEETEKELVLRLIRQARAGKPYAIPEKYYKEDYYCTACEKTIKVGSVRSHIRTLKHIEYEKTNTELEKIYKDGFY